jgi:hypothetical protein
VRKAAAWSEAGATITVAWPKVDQTELIPLRVSHHAPAIPVLVEVSIPRAPEPLHQGGDRLHVVDMKIEVGPVLLTLRLGDALERQIRRSPSGGAIPAYCTGSPIGVYFSTPSS